MRKRFDDFLAQAASSQVFAGVRALGAPQTFLKKCYGTLVDFEQHGAQFGFLGFRGTAETGLGQGNSQLLRHSSDGFREGDVFDLLDKAEYIA